MEVYLRSIDDAMKVGLPITPIFNGAAPGANTPIFPSDITPEKPEFWGISASFAVATVLNLTANDGTNPVFKMGLNKSIALSVNDLFVLVFAVHPLLAYNFEIETDAAINYLLLTRGRTGASQ